MRRRGSTPRAGASETHTTGGCGWAGSTGSRTRLTPSRRPATLQEASRSAEACAVLDRVLRTTNDPYAAGRRAGAAPLRADQSRSDGRVHPGHRGGLRRPSATSPSPTCTGTSTRWPRSPRTTRARWTAASPTWSGPPGRWARWRTADRDTAWGWHDLAMAYSYLSFHGYALGAIERARQLGAAAGIPEETFAAPGIRLRNAVALDHNGDSDGCLRVLRDIAADLARFVRDGRADRLRPSSLAAYGYAAARRAALGDPLESTGEAEPARLLGHGGDSARARDMRQLGEVCLAVADGRPDRGGHPAGRRPGRPPRRSARPSRPGCAASRCARAGDHAGRAPRRPAGVPARRAAQRPAARRLHRRHRRPDRPRGDAPGGGPVRGRGADRPADRAAQPASAGAVHHRGGVPGRAGGDRRLRPGRLQGGQHPARPPLRRPGAATHRRGDQPGDAPGRLRGPLRRRRVRGGAPGRRHGRGGRGGPPDRRGRAHRGLGVAGARHPGRGEHRLRRGRRRPARRCATRSAPPSSTPTGRCCAPSPAPAPADRAPRATGAVSGGSARCRRPAGRPGRPRPGRPAPRPARRRAPGPGCTPCSRSGGR